MKQTNQPGTGPRIAVIGGGAAGFFCAITAAESNPDATVTIFERGKSCLGKVRISGGGRCNVTHNCFDPEKLSTHYPRGSRELRSAFYRWQPEDTIAWFTERGVDLKTEEDQRVFPVSDDSQSIIGCLMDAARVAKVRLNFESRLSALVVRPDGSFDLELENGMQVRQDKVCIACGSLKGSPLLELIKSLGHSVEDLVPSLFAFNISDKRIHGLAGLSVPDARVRVHPGGVEQGGPLLVTHRGFSGPAILRLSAWEARALKKRNYQFDISVNWLGDVSKKLLRDLFLEMRQDSGKATVRNRPVGDIPRRLWERLLEVSGTDPDVRWAQMPGKQEQALITELLAGRYTVQGKTSNKEEFVTCGGVRLKEIDFRRMESRIVDGLHFAGECLDIDGITGGFNFQAAWTTGRIAGLAMAG